jgi:hypothetical protein
MPLITSLRSLCFLLFKTNRELAARSPFSAHSASQFGSIFKRFHPPETPAWLVVIEPNF